MSESKNEFKLATEIISLSVAKTWDEAKIEWELEEIYKQDVPETCLCGKFPILEICVLRNRRNGNPAVVGNVCVKKFMGLPSDHIFAAIKRVAGDIERPLNAETVNHAHRRGWINSWERDFYFDTMRKRSLSGKQNKTRVKINRKVLERTSRKSPPFKLPSGWK